MTISAYYTMLKGLSDEVEEIQPLHKSSCSTCDHKMEKQVLKICKEEQLYDYLMGRDDVFNIVKSQCNLFLAFVKHIIL